MGDQAAINSRILPGRFLLDCSTRQRIKASPERPAPLALFDVALFSTDFITRPGIPWGNCFG
jgi:hypothetical protein